MSQPTPYSRVFDFNDADFKYPSQLEAELNAIKQTTDEILVNLVILQRDDTLLGNNVVHPDSFTPASLLLMAGGWTLRGTWAPDVKYEIGDVVNQGGAVPTSARSSTIQARSLLI